MPQIWMTYAELANLFSCTEVEARKLANKQRLDRTTGHDGESRVRLCPVGVAVFTEKVRAPNEALDRAIKDQHASYSEMQASLLQRARYYPWIG